MDIAGLCRRLAVIISIPQRDCRLAVSMVSRKPPPRVMWLPSQPRPATALRSGLGGCGPTLRGAVIASSRLPILSVAGL